MELSCSEVSALLQACLGWASLPTDKVHFSLVPELVTELSTSILNSPGISERPREGTDLRIVVAAAAALHPDTEGWRHSGLSRGLGESGGGVADGPGMSEGAIGLGMFIDFLIAARRSSGCGMSSSSIALPESLGGKTEELAVSTMAAIESQCLEALGSLPMDQRLRLVDAYAKLSTLRDSSVLISGRDDKVPEGFGPETHQRASWRDAAVGLLADLLTGEGPIRKARPQARHVVAAAVLSMRLRARGESLEPLAECIRSQPRTVGEEPDADSARFGLPLGGVALSGSDLVILTTELLSYLEQQQGQQLRALDPYLSPPRGNDAPFAPSTDIVIPLLMDLLDQLLGHLEGEEAISPSLALALAKPLTSLVSSAGVPSSALMGWKEDGEANRLLVGVTEAACRRVLEAVRDPELWSTKTGGRTGGSLLPQPGFAYLPSSSLGPHADRMIEVSGLAARSPLGFAKLGRLNAFLVCTKLLTMPYLAPAIGHGYF